MKMNEIALKNLTVEELLRFVDRSSIEVKLLAEALELELEHSTAISEKYYHEKAKLPFSLRDRH